MEKFRIAGLELRIDELEYDGMRFVERVVYDGDERIAKIVEDEDGKYVLEMRPRNRIPFLGLGSFDRPDDAVIVLANHLRRTKVESMSDRGTVLGNARVTGDAEVRGVPGVFEFSDGDLFVKRFDVPGFLRETARILMMAPEYDLLSKNSQAEIRRIAADDSACVRMGLVPDYEDGTFDWLPSFVRMEVDENDVGLRWCVEVDVAEKPRSVNDLERHVVAHDRLLRLARALERIARKIAETPKTVKDFKRHGEKK